MDDLLDRLETQLRAFIHHYEQLRQANVSLEHEKESLLSKQHTVVSQIQTLVSRLKSLETSS